MPRREVLREPVAFPGVSVEYLPSRAVMASRL